MKKSTALSLILITIFFGGVIHHRYQVARADDTARELVLRKRIFPDAEHFSNKTGALPHYKAYTVADDTKLKELMGAVFVTTDVTPDIRGYAGPVKLLVGVATDGTIAGVEVISHNETPAYVGGLEAFLARFRGQPVIAPLRIGEDIDGISRATVTSRAIARTLREGGRQVAGGVLGLSVPSAAADRQPVNWTPVILTLLLFALAITAVLKNDDRLRWAALAGGLLYFGLIESTMVSLVQFVNIGLGQVPLFSAHPLWYALAGFTVISLLLVGNVYCGCLCPFAGLQEFLYKISGRLRPKQSELTHRLLTRAHGIRYFVLFALLILCFAAGSAAPANVEVYVLLFSGSATALGWTFIGLMLAFSVFHYRFWCRFLCPLGALNGLLAGTSLYKVRLDEGCGGCEACAKLCPTDAIDMRGNTPLIHHEECILCGKCMHRCPKGVMHLTVPVPRQGAVHEKS